MKPSPQLVSSGMPLLSIFILSLAPLCLGQQPQPSTTSTAPAATHTIGVGDGDHKFKPETVQAAVGDIIEFRFFPQNHSVVRAEYEYPCVPYEMIRPNQTGFYSGFHPVDSVLPDPPKYQIRVNDTAPVFFYCSAPNSCIKYGMVGAINPNSSASLSHQRDIARKSSYSLSPGEPFPEEGDSPTATPTPPAPPTKEEHSKSLSPGAIAGIVIAVIVGLVVLGCLAFFIGRSRTMKQEIARRDCTVKCTTPPSPSAMLQYTPNPMFAHGYFQHTHEAPAYDYGHYPPTSRGSVSSPPRLNRTISNRSVGGTFDLSSTTGYYTRTHDGEDTYKYCAPSSTDAESPILGREHESYAHFGPTAEPVGSYESHFGDGHGGAGLYYGDGMYEKEGNWDQGEAAVNEGRPAEMDGAGVDGRLQV